MCHLLIHSFPSLVLCFPCSDTSTSTQEGADNELLIRGAGSTTNAKMCRIGSSSSPGLGNAHWLHNYSNSETDLRPHDGALDSFPWISPYYILYPHVHIHAHWRCSAVRLTHALERSRWVAFNVTPRHVYRDVDVNYWIIVNRSRDPFVPSSQSDRVKGFIEAVHMISLLTRVYYFPH